ncbi:MAG: phage portal protein [Planctomycetota bacterium]
MTTPLTFTVDTDAPTSVAPATAARLSADGGYAAVERPDGDGTRRSPSVRVVSEDRVLQQRKRQRLSASSLEAHRNMAVVQWAIGKHLDYVSRFRFRGMTDDEAFNRELEAFVALIGTALRFDLAGRHNLARSVRLTECLATLEGDSAWLKRGRGRALGLVELIEGNRIRHDELRLRGRDRDGWTNGVRVDPATGRALEYAIANRGKGGSGWDGARRVRARDLLTRGYFFRFDQFRGVSPFVSALSKHRDVDESFDLVQAKLKLWQMMGFAVTRRADGPLGDYLADDLRQNGESDPADGEPRYDFGLGGGLFTIDLDRGDGVDTLESKTPATETIAFLKLMIHVAIRALDLPYSFWDESHTNFYGQRGSFLSYIQSCQVKRADNVELLDAWTRWRLGVAIARGELTLPRGWEFSDLRWQWIAVGQPWWDPNKEIAAQLSAISAGLTNPQRVCHETGTDFEENVDATAKALEYARGAGVTLSFDVGAAHAAAVEEAAREEAAADEARRRGEDPDDDSGEGEGDE